MSTDDPMQEDMEAECRLLQENLRDLTEARAALQEEFSQLGSMYGKLMVQLKGDTLAGEGQLHAFHAEKHRMEERLEALEGEIALKDERLAQLDARASDYLLRVTTASNALEDEAEKDPELNEDEGQVRNLVQQLVLEDMEEEEHVLQKEEHDKDDEGEEESEEEESRSSASILQEKKDEDTLASLSDEVDDEEVTAGQVTPPLSTLSALVEELRRVKDEMGRCVSASQRSSIMALEGELQATKDELAFLRCSMSDLRGSYQPSETGLEDHLDVPLDEFVFEGRSSSLRGDVSPFGGMFRSSSGVRSPSGGNLSGRVAQLEREAVEAQERMTEAQKQVTQLTKERTQKERECKALQRKVLLVERRAAELQTAFDTFVNAVVRERDDLKEESEELKKKIKEQTTPTETSSSKEDLQALEKYKLQLEVCQGSFQELETSHAKEMEKLKKEHRTTEEDLKKRVLQLEEDSKNQHESLKKALQEVNEEQSRRQKVELELQAQKDKVSSLEADVATHLTQKEALQGTVTKLETELSTFAPSFREEMTRMKEDFNRTLEEKKTLEKTLEETLDENRQAEKRTEGLNELLEQLRQKLTRLTSTNEDLTSRMTSKDEELIAREATIQELRVTLTNNQKQSRENYQMLQDDMAALQMRLAREKEESQVLLDHLKDKLLKAEEKSEEWQKKAGEPHKSQQQENAAYTDEEQEPQILQEELSEWENSSQFNPDNGQKKELENPSTSTEAQLINSSEEVVIDHEKDESTSSSKSESVQVLQTKLVTLEAALKEKDSLVLELEDKLQKAQEEDLRSKFEQQMAKIKELNEFVEELRSKVDCLTGKSSELQKTLEKVEEEKETLTQALEEAKATSLTVEKVEEEKENLTQALQQAEATSQVLKEELGAKKNLVEGVEELFRVFQCSVLGSSDMVVVGSLDTSVNTILKKVECELTVHLTKISEYEKENTDLKKNLDCLKDEYEKEIKELKCFIDSAKDEYEKETNDLKSSLESVKIEYEKEISVLKSAKDNYEKEIKDLKSSLESAKDEHDKESSSLKKNLESVTEDHERERSDLNKSLECAKDKQSALAEQVTDLEERLQRLLQEKEEEAREFELERTRAYEMQNQMVSDLEKLVLGLEKDKKELEEELKKVQNHQQEMETERGILLQEMATLKVTLNENSESESLSLIQDLTKRSESLELKLLEAERSLEEKESSFKTRLLKEQLTHEHKIDSLRRDLREEMDILEQQKDDLRQELRWEVERVEAEWAVRLEEAVREQESRLLEEKSQFGRVLVAKNDEYEHLREETLVEVAGYRARLTDLQAQLEEKSHLIDDLETNLEEIVVVRDNLEEKLDLLMGEKKSVSGNFDDIEDDEVPRPSSLRQLLSNASFSGISVEEDSSAYQEDQQEHDQFPPPPPPPPEG